ncbi:uncharacterized protein LOC136026757 [Artemia franciscana]|uniref:uncharacterized protein LOC136026757 n=1 Tax=Artemia franciscana TaxID=6661 RepID=UPI0032DB0DD5
MAALDAYQPPVALPSGTAMSNLEMTAAAPVPDTAINYVPVITFPSPSPPEEDEELPGFLPKFIPLPAGLKKPLKPIIKPIVVVVVVVVVVVAVIVSVVVAVIVGLMNKKICKSKKKYYPPRYYGRYGHKHEGYKHKEAYDKMEKYDGKDYRRKRGMSVPEEDDLGSIISSFFGNLALNGCSRRFGCEMANVLGMVPGARDVFMQVTDLLPNTMGSAIEHGFNGNCNQFDCQL